MGRKQQQRRGVEKQDGGCFIYTPSADTRDGFRRKFITDEQAKVFAESEYCAALGNSSGSDEVHYISPLAKADKVVGRHVNSAIEEYGWKSGSTQDREVIFNQSLKSLAADVGIEDPARIMGDINDDLWRSWRALCGVVKDELLKYERRDRGLG